MDERPERSSISLQPTINPSTSTSTSTSSHSITKDHRSLPSIDQPPLSIQSSSGHQTIQLIPSNRSLTLITILHHPNRSILNLLRSISTSSINPDRRQIEIEYEFILNCKLTDHQSTTSNTDHVSQTQPPLVTFELSFLTCSKSKFFKLETLTIQGQILPPPSIQDNSIPFSPQTWVENILLKSYESLGLPRNRRLLIFINPASGSKKSLRIWNSVVEPILKSSTCNYEVISTTHPGHAAEVGETLDVDSYDVLSCVSGDGMLHELLNGLGRRKTDAGYALNNLFLCSIPAGSGNAFSANHLGPQLSSNVHLATLNLLKGKPVRVDLCSTTQLADGSDEEGPKELEPIRKLSFLSTSFGLAAELDVGTDSLRWIGPTRFILGYIWGALLNRHQRIRLDVQLVHDDKRQIEQSFHQLREAIINQNQAKNQRQDSNQGGENRKTNVQDHTDVHSSKSSLPNYTNSNDLPSLKFGDIRTEIDSSPDSTSNSSSWKTIETEILSFYAGILPYMASDLLQFPAKVAGHDGTIDLALQHTKNAWATLSCVSGAGKGKLFMHKDFEFLKVKAFRLTPLGRSKGKNRGRKADLEEGERKKQEEYKKLGGGKKEMKEKGSSHIAVDGERLSYKPIQVEIHSNLLRTLSLTVRDSSSSPSSSSSSDNNKGQSSIVYPPKSLYFGSVGVPHHLL